jgi:hypothetical protein
LNESLGIGCSDLKRKYLFMAQADGGSNSNSSFQTPELQHQAAFFHGRVVVKQDFTNAMAQTETTS